MQEITVEGFQLSPQQRRLWLSRRGESASPYRAQVSARVGGRLDAPALEAALAEVVRRHEILRTSFETPPGLTTPVQVISEAGEPFSAELHDLSGQDARRQEAQLRALRERALGAELPAGGTPSLRAQLVRLSPDAHALILTLPALCADAAGLRNLLKDVGDCYAALASGAETPDEPMQYADLSQWQNELVESEESEDHRAYWRRLGLTARGAARLPYEPPAPAGEFSPRVLAAPLGADCAAKVGARAAAHGVSEEVFALACWQALLSRVTGRPEVVVGAAFDGRNYEGLEGALGLFVRYLPVACSLDEGLRFGELLRRLDESVAEGREYQEYFSWDDFAGDAGRAPLFDFGFDYALRPESYTNGGLTFSVESEYVCAERFKVRLACLRGADGLTAELHYDAALFTEEEMLRLAEGLRRVFESAAGADDETVEGLEVVGEAERRRVLSDFNGRAAAYAGVTSVHALFEAQAAREPEAEAVVCEGGRLSYGELNARANRLARRLRRMGVGPEAKVGLLLERSAEMIVGLLAVLKAGGCYVPLDPSFPRERLSFILEDTRAKVLLTQESLLDAAPQGAAQAVCVDAEGGAAAPEDSSDLGVAVRPENLAYVIYTSGSTGRPKGVGVEHRQLLNYLRAVGDVLDLPRGSGFATVSTLAADLGNTAVYPSLCGGGTLHVITSERATDPALLADYFTRHRVDCLKIVPSHLSALLNSPHAAQSLPRRRLVLGGEATRWPLFERLRELAPGVQIINHYGPTETTVGVLTHSARGEARDQFSATLPLGKPLANTRVYVLDRRRRPLPVGVAGEVYIGGAGVSRGYLGRPALTAERFVPDPFSSEPGARLYRTGDLARHLPDGAVEFLGRADDQVKIRGYRIELGEIEAAMRAHPAVSEAVVTAHEDEAGERRLTGYVVPGRRHREVIEGRRRFRLPNGMAIVQQNRSETEYLFREIFEEAGYMRHGVELPADACVFDVGANIGMFTLFAGRGPNAKVYAFEPIGEVCEALRLNAELYGGPGVKVFNHGLSDEEKQAAFTYYPQQTVMSGASAYADAAYEMEVVRGALGRAPRGADDARDVEELLRGSFAAQSQACRLRRLSDVMREEGVERIDLLKIDVQRAELDVLRGVNEEDWPKIRQVAMEVHDAPGQASEGRLREAVSLLEGRGFSVVAEQGEALKGTDRHNLYAVRRGRGAGAAYAPAPAEAGAVTPREEFGDEVLSGAQVRAHLRERLPEYMIPSHVLLLDELPLTPNGKLDRHALPAPGREAEETERLAPRTPTEEMVCAIWAEVLGVESAGAGDNFFDLGGHSLLATQMMSRVRAAFGVELHLRGFFGAPTARGLSRLIDLAVADKGGVAAPPITPADRAGKLPLSFAQQRLWFIDQLEPMSAVYNVPAALRLQGRLDAASLGRALTEIVRRHEALRTKFVLADGDPVQVVEPAEPFKPDFIDLSHLADAEREAAAQELAREEAARPFDLSRAPLLRALLARLSDEEHVLLFTMHHIVTDGWSMGVLVNEVAALYAAFLEGEESPLAELPVQYADFAAWQREWMSGEVLERELQYWRTQLEGAPPVLELPTDRPRSVVQTPRGATYSFALPQELTERLRRLSREEGATLFMTLLAGFQALLSRYSGQRDVVVGSPIANRNRAETEPLIGFFVNTLALRTDLSGSPSFRELLRRVRETCLGAYAHQDVPFEKLVEELEPERSLGRNPLFQAAFVLQNAPVGELSLPGLRLLPAAAESRAAKFDLTLLTEEREGGVGATLEYDADLFEAGTAERMARHLVALLSAATADPSLPVESLDLLSGEERRLLADVYNRTASAYPREASLASLFEWRAALSPDAAALAFGDGLMSYAELNEKANRLARHLRSLGVGAETRVGVLMERSAELVVSLLAVLKAGGAYVPLDPEYPLERLSFMLEDSRAPVLLTQSRLRRAAGGYEGRVVAVDELEEELSALPGDDLPEEERGVGGSSLAYVIYTSGSTGRPKGVMVEQRSVARLVLNTDYVSLSPSDCIAQISNSSFDAMTFELWGALLNGARLEIIEKETALDLREFAAALGARRVTALFMTTALFNQMAHMSADVFGSLRYVLFGGEACDAGAVRRVARGARPAQLLHVYGPTENTTFSTWFEVTEVGEEATTVAIGGPVANTTAYVLDENYGLTPEGVAGELYLGGDGLARGYMNGAALTAERFVPDPFSGEPGARLYRTGDVVRRGAGGRIEFVGRRDHQVKVRGFRVEPGEIEAALCAHPDVREAVVVALGEGADKRLVAYLTCEEGAAAVEAARWREYLTGRMPPYMAPSAFVTLGALPLTPNGKVDRKALPAPAYDAAESGRDFAPPATPTQEVLCGIFADLLGLARVGVNDNFFDLGGHSLLATQLMSRARAAFAVELPLRLLFESPTVAELARRVEAGLRAGAGEQAPPVTPVGRAGALPLSFAQQRLWFLDQLEPGSAFYNVPAAVRLCGSLDARVLGRALSEVVRRHESLRTTFAVTDGEPTQVIHDAAPVTLPVEDLGAFAKAERESEARRLAAEESARPFDLSAGPLLRARLLRLNEEEHVLLFTMHHIVSDGWSMSVLVKEVAALYAAFLKGKESPLAELTVQYADFAAWQRGWMQGEVLERELQYWRGQLGGELPVLELPTDRPRPAVQTFRGARHSFTLPQELAGRLEGLSRREGVTLFMTLLAAWQALLSRYSGQDDVVVGSPIANRNRAETEGLIGFFVNTLALRTDLSGEPTFRELLGRVRETCLGAYGHQDVPFERLVEELQPERSLSRTPLFQVLFTLQNRPDEALELPGLSLKPVEFEDGTAKFDLSLYIVDGREQQAGVIVYNTDLFDAEAVGRMAGHLEQLLWAATSDPERRITELPLLAEAERRLVLAEFNDTRRDFPLDKCVHQLFEEQAARTPDAVAAVYGAQSLTYAELNARANQLARHLAEMGVGPEFLVALLARRGLDFLTAVLAVFKAGGAYLPLDPLHPPRRLAQVLSRSGSELVLAADEFAEKVAQVFDGGHFADAPARPPVVSLEGLLARGHAGENLPARNRPENLAYVIYTSGSTGLPKGAMLEQRGMCNHLLAKVESLRLTGADVVAQTATQCFDVSVWQMLSALLAGGGVYIADEELALDSIGQLGMIAERGVTILEIVPSQLRVMVDGVGRMPAPERPDLSPLRWLIVNGEPLLPELCRQWFDLYPATPLINAYGPTECSDDVTQHVIQTPPPRTLARVPIGGALSNMRMYVLDRKMSPAPVGVGGELYVGGVGVGRGYRADPGRTALSFIPDPFGETPGARLYKTGDLVRHLPDGRLDFLQRVDHQVKVRGFRIELGEVEAALAQHPSVNECVCVVREDAQGAKRLVAYVAGEKVAGSAELAEHLRGRLPEYMVPSAFVTLGALPLTPNGKVDRKALPAPAYDASEAGRDFAPPATPTQEVLCGIFADLLGLARVGVHDNFFDLGGHSLLATQLMSRARAAFAVELPLRLLFESPTVAELARRVEAGLRAGAGEQAPAVTPVGRAGALPLSFAQQRLWFLDQLEPGSAFYNVPAAVRLSGRLEAGVLARVLTEVVRRHESLRTTFAVAGGQPVQVIHPASEMTLEVEDLCAFAESERESEARRLAGEEARRPFDLSAGPLLRARLLRLSEEEHVLLFTMHHIVSDGWSMGVLVNEVARLYEAFLKGEASPLPELPVQYADFAAWQRGWMQGEVLERELQYWRGRLGGELPVLELPTDRPRPAVQTFHGRQESFVLSAELSESLQALSRRRGVTMFMLLLAAWKVLLSRYTRQEDILIGAAIANRNRAEVEPLIGFFINMLVLRTDLSGDPPFAELLRRVKDVALGAYAHQDVPFEKLIEEFVPARATNQTPLVQTAFGFNNAPRQEFKLAGLTLESLPFDNDAGRFDLTLWFDKPADELRATWYYNTDLFDAATIARMQGRFETLLRSVVASPDARLSELEMFTEEERRLREAEKQGREEANRKRLRSARRKFVGAPQPAAADAQPSPAEGASAGD